MNPWLILFIIICFFYLTYFSLLFYALFQIRYLLDLILFFKFSFLFSSSLFVQLPTHYIPAHNFIFIYHCFKLFSGRKWYTYFFFSYGLIIIIAVCMFACACVYAYVFLIPFFKCCNEILMPDKITKNKKTQFNCDIWHFECHFFYHTYHFIE